MNRVNFFNAAVSTRRHKKKIIREKLMKFQRDILIPNGLEFLQVRIGINQFDNQFRNIDEFNGEIMYLERQQLEPEEMIRKTIFIKDKNNISDRTYTSLQSELDLDLPTLYRIRKKIKDLDQTIEIMENQRGVYVDIKTKLKLLIPKIKENFVNQNEQVDTGITGSLLPRANSP